MSHNHTHEGGCTCGHVRYKMTSDPLIVHCCHCRWCQRQTGASFALNALIETERVVVLEGDIDEVTVESPSGYGQIITRCPKCRIAVWSNYLIGDDDVRLIRVGTLDNPDLMPPDVHIYTSTKQPWGVLPPDDYVVEEYYETEKTWSPDALKRRDVMISNKAAQDSS